MTWTDEFKARLSALAAAVRAAEYAETANGFRGKPVVLEGKRRAAAARLRDLVGFVSPGERPPDAELYALLGYDAPRGDDPSRPVRGSRVVALYQTGPLTRYARPVAAVRKRPNEEAYEAVSGREVFGARGGSRGHKWDELHGVFPSASAAKDRLAEVFAGRLRVTVA